jgi:hypothetical protein
VKLEREFDIIRIIMIIIQRSRGPPGFFTREGEPKVSEEDSSQ